MHRDCVPVVAGVVEPRRQDVFVGWPGLGFLEVRGFQVRWRVSWVVDRWVDPDIVLGVAVLAEGSLAFVEVVALYLWCCEVAGVGRVGERYVDCVLAVGEVAWDPEPG